MTQTKLISTIIKINSILDENKAHAYACGNGGFWERDANWVRIAYSNIMEDDLSSIKKVFDEMRNLSQGFGSYLPDLDYCDRLLNDLFSLLEENILRKRNDGG